MTKIEKAVLLIAEILYMLAGRFMPDCGGDFVDHYYCEKCKDYNLCKKMAKVENINSELQRVIASFGDTEDMYETDTAYCGGLSDGSGGNINSNPYNPKKDIGLYEQYERGYFDGRVKREGD